ncbi:MAG: hypothetical protein RIB45_06250 [Marivibrio sp.]|uniref:hypothetical protein n=1 Tax=Marivibrio sp. TaxID=2039719 RepID=UPI0032EC29C0
MQHDHDASPLQGGDFPEEERVRDGPMRHEIMTMVVEALNRQGYPDLTAETLTRDPAHKAAALDMLRDCRPMPVVLQLIDDVERGARVP